MKKKNFLVEEERKIPVMNQVDVLVAGGGPAGIAAAISAARLGADTLLVERYGYLGGMITGAHVVWVLGVGDGYRPKAQGIVEEIKKRLEPLQAVTRSSEYGDYAVEAEVFKWQAAEMIHEADGKILLHTLACQPILKNNRVHGVITESKSGRQAILASVVIDCTADGDMAYRAGCLCENQTHDVSLRVVIEGIQQEKVNSFAEKNPEKYQEIIRQATALNGGTMPNQIRHLKGIDITDAAALSRTEIQIRRECFSALYFLRENLPGWENARIKETGPQLGVRQSRRILGEYILRDEDLRASKHFSDTIVRLGCHLAANYALYNPKGLDFDIPYRCLVPRKIEGLLVAGRCISADYQAANTVRLIVPCLATGQAAGVAAAISVREKISLRELPVKEIQAVLRKQGVFLGDD
ncbi:MAG: FAD-dependent oxidoreductase [Candidatus Omnitrophica bacterium]|nr:FAD-dependent oxidoreductase [Candidatus Omnitrophota bacterium]